MKKSFADLSRGDVARYPVWRFTNNDLVDEFEIEPVSRSEFRDLSGLIIASEVKFADGSVHVALFQNVNLNEPELNDHFLSLTVERNGKWFSLARYHDAAIEKWGPTDLAEFVGREIDEVFPIQYDLREVLKLDSRNLVGTVRIEPDQRLTDEELLALIIR